MYCACVVWRKCRSVLRAVVGWPWRWFVHVWFSSCNRYSLRCHRPRRRLCHRPVSRLSPQTALSLHASRPLLGGRRHAVEAARRWSVVAEARHPEHVRSRSRPTAIVAGFRTLRRRADDGAATTEGLQQAEVRRHPWTKTEQSVCRGTYWRSRLNATTATEAAQTFQTVAKVRYTSVL